MSAGALWKRMSKMYLLGLEESDRLARLPHGGTKLAPHRCDLLLLVPLVKVKEHHKAF